jgi:hypothetical protein
VAAENDVVDAIEHAIRSEMSRLAKKSTFTKLPVYCPSVVILTGGTIRCRTLFSQGDRPHYGSDIAVMAAIL